MFLYKFNLRFFLVIFIITVAVGKSQTPGFQWANQIAGNQVDRGQSIVTDNQGYIYTTGAFEDTTDFDPGIGVVNLISKGVSDIFVSKSAADGSLIWVKQMGGSQHDIGYSICIDQKGYVYVTGSFMTTADFNMSSGTSTLTSYGKGDAFISKLDNLGNLIWVKQIGGSMDDFALSLTVDNIGNIYSTGTFEGTCDFDPDNSVLNFTSTGPSDAFLTKLDSLGNLIWAKQYGGSDYDYGQSISSDLSGNIYLTGMFRDTIDFDPGPGIVALSSAGDYDVFIAKLNVFGNLIWVKQVGGNKYDTSNSIALSKSGNIYISGSFKGNSDFDPSLTLYTLTSSGIWDGYILKLDSNGIFIWAKKIGGVSTDNISSICLDAFENVYATGYFQNTADFDPNIGTSYLNSNGYEDIFISILNSSGNYIWAGQIGSAGGDYGISLYTDNSNNIYVTGMFGGSADFDPTTGIFNINKNSNYWDMYTLKLTANIVGINEIAEKNDLLKVFPNPNNGKFIIESKNGAKYSITNEIGQIIQTFELNEINNYTQSIEVLTNGIYFIMGLNNNQITNQKIVVIN